MILEFPQWQGVGYESNIGEGAKRMKALIADQSCVSSVPVAPLCPLHNEDGIMGNAAIMRQLEAAAKIIAAKNPDRILTIGGDCSIEITSTAWLNEKYKGDLQIFWLDTHSDINTVDSSFSAHLHGMALTPLLGEVGMEAFSHLVPRKITHDQIAYFGLTSIDPPEEEYINQHNIKNLSFDEILTMPKKYNNAIVHLDCDVMDRTIFDECSTPTTGGVDEKTLMAALTHLFKTYNVVGATITEYAPKKQDKALPLITNILQNGLKANDPMWK